MKYLLIIIGAVLFVGSTLTPSPESVTAKAPEISIHDAVAKGNIEAVKYYLINGTKVDAMTDDGLTELFAAILSPHKVIAELLISKGADVNARGFLGMTPLNMAADEGQKEIADLLRYHGGKTSEELKAKGK